MVRQEVTAGSGTHVHGGRGWRTT